MIASSRILDLCRARFAGVAPPLLLGLALAAAACGSGGESDPPAREAGTRARPAGVTVPADHRGPTTKSELGDTILFPPALGTLRTSRRDALGNPAGVPCSTCHADRPARMVGSPEELRDFHTDLELAHGDLGCGACHDESDRDKLRLADGDAVPFTEVVKLCAQCHGPTYRSYRNGAHGGMVGHWDRERGERERLSCVSCHDPHAPAIPRVRPAPPPRDRFFEPEPPSRAGAPDTEDHHD